MNPVTIIGSGFAAYQLVKTLRRLDQQLPIRIITADKGHDYNKPDLSHVISRQQTSQQLISTASDVFACEHNIELYAEHWVEEISSEQNAVFANGKRFDYSNLVLATGAAPFLPPIELHDPYYQAILKQYEDYQVASSIDTAPMEEEEINSLMESYTEPLEEPEQYEPHYTEQCDKAVNMPKEEIDSLLDSYREPSDECDLEMMLKYDSFSIECEPPAYLTENTPTQEPLESTTKNPSEFQNCPF
ncbi:FAD-dependent oxidoreductase [Vibrio breoganii]|uniref:FAD/NAD(P)-binding domain-containing protein n=1 Tax=Vibrio breoganii TaxID=553239 RepID=A0AAP8SXT9_9VIBR|nr:FAD-dependent oxidoreductase [Vibrio breoganii]PMP13121.1 hypothetical protein BCS93_06010 [Vibrio breoganii]